MCLLAVMHHIHPEAPLVVAANRDEDLSRPAVAMTVLQESTPRIVGGRDLQAGGTWLAINEHGVMAGLTNRPSVSPGAGRRSRGELPLALAAHPSAERAVQDLRQRWRPADFRPGWLLVGDGRTLFSVDMTGGDHARITELRAGIHVLENRPPGTRSPKVLHSEAALRAALALRGDDLRQHLTTLLASHALPQAAAQPLPGEAAPRPVERQTACVHSGRYGTRSSLIGFMGDSAPPRLWSAAGPPCTAPMLAVRNPWGPVPAA